MALRQSPVLTGNAAERPASGNFVGQHYVAVDTGAASVWDGSAWVTSGGGGGGWVKRSTQLELLYPRGAVSANMGISALAWTFGSYATLTASAAADFFPCSAYLFILLRPRSTVFSATQFEVEIATGAVGAEVLYGRFSGSFVGAVSVDGVENLLSLSATFPLGPAKIPSGTRVVCRIRKSRANADVVFSGSRLYIAGYDTSVPASDTTYTLDSYLGGTPSGIDSQVTPLASTLSVPAAAYPTYGAWTEVIASAPRDLLVWGNSVSDASSGLNGGMHVQFGIGAAGAEVAYSQIGNPAHSGVSAGIYTLRRPLLVLAGERLAVRQSGANATNMQIMYEDL